MTYRKLKDPKPKERNHEENKRMIIKMFQVNGDILEAYVLELQTIHEWTLPPKAIIQEGNMINTQLQ